MSKFLTVVGAIIVALALIVLGAFITGLLVMVFWNWLMPVLFGLPMIGYWQGWGLAVLGGLLFKNSTVTTKSNND